VLKGFIFKWNCFEWQILDRLEKKIVYMYTESVIGDKRNVCCVYVNRFMSRLQQFLTASYWCRNIVGLLTKHRSCLIVGTRRYATILFKAAVLRRYYLECLKLFTYRYVTLSHCFWREIQTTFNVPLWNIMILVNGIINRVWNCFANQNT
jgi:hypothetical protein